MILANIEKQLFTTKRMPNIILNDKYYKNLYRKNVIFSKNSCQNEKE